jgi:hypothetical protein
MAEAVLSRPAKTLLSLERQGDRVWFLPGVGLFPLCDYLLPFMPNQILLAGLSMVLPRRWIALAITFAVATAAGAALITAAIQSFGSSFAEQMFGDVLNAGAFAGVVAQIAHLWPPSLGRPGPAALAAADGGAGLRHRGIASCSGRACRAGGQGRADQHLCWLGGQGPAPPAQVHQGGQAHA